MAMDLYSSVVALPNWFVLNLQCLSMCIVCCWGAKLQSKAWLLGFSTVYGICSKHHGPTSNQPGFQAYTLQAVLGSDFLTQSKTLMEHLLAASAKSSIDKKINNLCTKIWLTRFLFSIKICNFSNLGHKTSVGEEAQEAIEKLRKNVDIIPIDGLLDIVENTHHFRMPFSLRMMFYAKDFKGFLTL